MQFSFSHLSKTLDNTLMKFSTSGLIEGAGAINKRAINSSSCLSKKPIGMALSIELSIHYQQAYSALVGCCC